MIKALKIILNSIIMKEIIAGIMFFCVLIQTAFGTLIYRFLKSFRGWSGNAEKMTKKGYFAVCVGLLIFSGAVNAQEELSVATVSTESSQRSRAAGVTAVYGVTADDYLPQTQHTAREYLRPHLRKSSSRPQFDLPDPFYFIGGPIFLLILLRVLVIFINGFEEKRKEEENQVASEHFNPE